MNWGELARLTSRHLVLVGVSSGVAIMLSVPVGIWLTRRPRLRGPVLGAANIFQTIPSLALFGLLIPLPLLGVSAQTAIVALTLYALLPIIRNTYTGIRNVDPAAIEVGRGMGMSDRQLLLMVELPLAASVILAGIRVAVVISVGIATIAAAIGAGGLGVPIFRGLTMMNNGLILQGAIPAAALALTLDALLGLLERRLKVH